MTKTCSRIYKRRGHDITLERGPVSGLLLLSTIVDSQLLTRRFFGYTVKEALDLFLIHIEESQA